MKPDPQADHAVRMTKFARECMRKVTDLTHKLETSLGPDTGDLSMRFGLHSGPVTAGVLRGEKSRFQLFGDTVNTGKVVITEDPMSRASILCIMMLTSYSLSGTTSVAHGKYWEEEPHSS